MAWVTPPVFAVGDTLGAAAMNLIGGDLDYLYANSQSPADPWIGTTANDSNTTVTANQAFLFPVAVVGPMTITTIGISIATSAGNIDVGVYTLAGAQQVSLGSTASPGTGARQFTVSTTPLVTGNYYLAVAGNNAGLALYGTDTTNVLTGVALKVATSFPLPTTITPGALHPNVVPCIIAY